MDFPATANFVGTKLIIDPKTMKMGPIKYEFAETIQAVEVFPMLVPSKIKILSLNPITPELTNVTVKDDTMVLD